MKTCPKCGSQLQDDVTFCPECGENVEKVEAAKAEEEVKSFDHTSEFTEEDISQNKVICMVLYLLGAFGLLIGMIAGTKSDYVAFHIRQALKLTVVEAIVLILTIGLCWTFIVPIAGVICMGIILVLRVLSFFQICSGKAIEPAIIRGLKFLK